MKTGKKISIVLIILLIVGGIYYSVTNCIFTTCDKSAVDSVAKEQVIPDTLVMTNPYDSVSTKSDSVKK